MDSRSLGYRRCGPGISAYTDTVGNEPPVAQQRERVMCCGEVIGREPSLRAFSNSPCAHLALDAEPRASALARAFVKESVPADDEDLASDVALLTSELVTNAVLHARTP